MRNLFQFLWRNQFFTLFIILEIVSVLLLSNSFSYQRTLKFNFVNDFSGSIFSSYSGITNYFGLQQENDKLVVENARLRSLVPLATENIDSLSVHPDSLYTYIPAMVVSSTVSNPNNLIMVNKGEKDGVEKEMGAISSMGIVGIVIGVSEHYSVIMSMLHQNMKISGRIKSNYQLINVVWDQTDYLLGTIIDIPSQIQLQPGDSIVTSGNSLIFPKDLLIGVVTSHERNTGGLLSTAILEFSTDFNSLRHVYLIKNQMAAEQDSLLIKISE
ncbi:MAG: rod shape-determining protein MreC [Bacteroidales bacterium]|nr:rod shape-determining protein MreC [Bacteroidales bacterium]